MSRTTPEGKVKENLKKIYRKFGDAVVLVQPLGTVFNRVGVHDHILCVRGRFLAVEAKSGDNNLTGAQALFGREVLAAGGACVMVNEDRLDEFHDLLQLMVNNPDAGMIAARALSWRAPFLEDKRA